MHGGWCVRGAGGRGVPGYVQEAKRADDISDL